MNVTKLKAGIMALKVSESIAIETEPEDSFKSFMTTLKFLVKRGYGGVIMLTNRPFSQVDRLCSENKIDTTNLFFVDCMSLSETQDVKKAENVRYIREPTNITELQMSLYRAPSLIRTDKKFFLIDSVDTFMMYLDPVKVKQFIHGALMRLRLNEISGILFLSKRDKSQKIRTEIIQLADRTIKA